MKMKVSVLSGQDQITEDSFQKTSDAERIEFCKSRYPYNCIFIAEFENKEIVLKPGEYVWLSVPSTEIYKLKVFSDQGDYEFNFYGGKGYSWWMLTV